MASVTNSILDSIKDRLDIDRSDDTFDDELIPIINGELAHLAQIGVGPVDGIEITDNSTEWSALIGSDKRQNFVRDYLAIATKLVFDPPASSAFAKALEDRKNEYEWRLNWEVDPKKMDK